MKGLSNATGTRARLSRYAVKNRDAADGGTHDTRRRDFQRVEPS